VSKLCLALVGVLSGVPGHPCRDLALPQKAAETLSPPDLPPGEAGSGCCRLCCARALAAFPFFPPSPDSSADKQGSLGLETKAGPRGGWPRSKRGSELMEPGNVLRTRSRRGSGIFLGSTDTPATPHQPVSPTPWDSIPAHAVRSRIHWAEQSRVPTSRSEAPSPSSRPNRKVGAGSP